MFDIHLLKFSNLVIVHTLDFWYMIKNKEATDSAALEFCHILNKFAAQLDECLSFKVFCLKRSFRASFRRKLGESAICSKYEQNSTAVLSVASLFFIIYSKSTVGQLQLKTSLLHPSIYNSESLLLSLSESVLLDLST